MGLSLAASHSRRSHKSAILQVYTPAFTVHAMEPKYPHVVVQLTGKNGNAITILGHCIIAAREAGVTETEVALFLEDATQRDYDHLLRVCMEWFEIA